MKGTKKLDFKDQNIYIGIDVHKNSWSATFITEYSSKKTVRFEKPFVKNLVNYTKRVYLNGNFKCAYEAGFSGFWAQRALSKEGFETIVVNPADIPTSDKDRRFKNDGRDSHNIAAYLKAGKLEAIHCPGQIEEQDRSLLRVKNQIAKIERQSKNRIKSLLLFLGIEIPEEYNNSRWSSRFITWLHQKSLEQKLTSLSHQLSTLENIRSQHATVIKSLRNLCEQERHKEVCTVLKSIPGIGPLTSIKLKLELISMERFSNTDRLLSYLGLIPTTKHSGEKERIGKITKRGRSEIRRSLIESAWVAIRHDAELGLQYQNWKKEKGANKAIVKIAVKLARRIRWVWTQKQNYIPLEI
jgi:transposase